MTTLLQDDLWIKQSFMIVDEGGLGDAYVAALRIMSSADGKFTGTALGHNWALNTPPGFTSHADVPVDAFYAPLVDGGQGTYYSTAIDDNAVLMHVRCGVPKFNSMLRFFGNFYKVEAASLARTGRLRPGFFSALGSAVGTLFTIPLAPVLLVGKVARFMAGRPSSKYYYLNPTMHSYWAAVSSMVNGVVAGMGIHQSMFTSQRPGVGGEMEDSPGGLLDQYDSVWKGFSDYFPDIYNPRGFIDIMALSSRTARVAEGFRTSLEKRMVSARSVQERMDILFAIQTRNKETEFTSEARRAMAAEVNDGEYLTDYMEAYSQDRLGEYVAAQADNDALLVEPDELSKRAQELGGIGDYFTARGRDAAEFVTFRVESPGSQSESFSNSTKESGIASTINSLSSSARDARFNLADGNIDPTGITQTIMGAVKDVAMGVAGTLSIDGIAALAGSAFTDIPEMWDSSSADINRFSCTIPLRCPYNHPISRIQNLIIPLCSILAMGLPLSTGNATYTSPFLVQVFVRGRAHIRLGIVESISVTRGVGDVAWSNRGEWLGADVNIVFKELSNILHMPIGSQYDSGLIARLAQQGASFIGGEKLASTVAGFDASVYNDDTIYTDYINTLASIPLEDEINKTAKWAIRRRRAAMQNMQMSSRAWLSSFAYSGILGDIISAVHARGERGRGDFSLP